MNEYSWEEFKEAGGRFKPVISLGKMSGFGLSAGFTRTYSEQLKGTVGVKMYYDNVKSAIAFKFLKNREDGSLSVTLREKGGYIGARSFLGKYKIDQGKYAGRYIPREVKDDNVGRIFVIDLKEKNAKS